MPFKINLQILLKLSFIFTGIFLTSCNNDDSNNTDDDQLPVSELTGEIVWSKTYGGTNVDAASSVIRTSEGGFIVVGSTSSIDGDITTGRSGEDSDIWIIKIDANGEKIWDKSYGGSDNERANSINTTNDGNYIISGYATSNDGDIGEGDSNGFQDYWVLKINSNGDLLWEKNFGFAGSDQANQIKQTSDNGYIITGFFDVSASGGEGSDAQGNSNNTIIDDTRSPNGNLHGVGEFWVIKLDATGEKEWRRYFGGSNNDRSYDVVETDDNGFLISGTSESEDFDIIDPKGSYDFWVVKVDAVGNKEWTKSYGGSQIDNAYAMCKTQDGNFILAGDTRSNDQDITSSNGNADAWLVKINPTGTLIWQKNYGGTEFESSRYIENLNNGTYIVAGSSRSNNGDASTNSGENDMWLLLIDENGDLLFEKSVGGSNFDFADGATATNDGAVIIVGNTESSDGDIPENKGLKDFFIVKIK